MSDFFFTQHNNSNQGIFDFPANVSLKLSSGCRLSGLRVAYQTYGNLSEQRDNVVVICHPVTGDQFVASTHPITGKDGWWSQVVGPGLSIDTDRYFVICQNVLGSCMGTTGPASVNQETGQAWNTNFPMITIADMVNLQRLFLNYLGIQKIFCIVGGSMGGMQALHWASHFPDDAFCVIPIATCWRHSPQNIAFSEIGRLAIMADPDWQEGHYQEHQITPVKGLSVARMAAHITYMSEESLYRKFGRNLQDRANLSYKFEADFQVESYLRYKGISFVDRFDANSYLYLTKAMDYFDLSADYDGHLIQAFNKVKARFCILRFSSDWLFRRAQSLAIVRALNAVGAYVSFAEIPSDKGHDAFLMKEPDMFSIIKGFLDSSWKDWQAQGM